MTEHKLSERNHSESKKQLRDIMRSMRTALSLNEQRELSKKACARLLSGSEWHAASVVALYMSVRGEIDCGALLQNAWEKNKKVLLPLCSADEPGKMRLVCCSGPDDLRAGAFGIQEPVENPNSGKLPPPDLILVPGLAFDLDGNRLGMGGGYYDRLLSKPGFDRCLSIGFAYSFQVVNRLPAEEHDRRVRALCTDENFIRIKNDRHQP